VGMNGEAVLAMAACTLFVLFIGTAFRAARVDALLRRVGGRRVAPAASRRRRGHGAASAPGLTWTVLAGHRGIPSAACAVSGSAIGLWVGGPPLALAGVVAGGAAPRMLASRHNRRRRLRSEEQLADAVSGVSAALRAGMSLSQAIRFAAREIDDPVSSDLDRVADREAMGLPLDAALDLWAAEAGSLDVRLAVGVLQLHHRVGGHAPVVLDDVARTLRHRRAAETEVRSLTAQARLSGAILGLLPIGFFLFMSVVARADIETALGTRAGLLSIGLGLLLDSGAYLWIRHLLRVAA
jgi:Flp pilus assembly protein TadB